MEGPYRLQHRRDLTESVAEAWRPPLFATGSARRRVWTDSIRRTLDLPARSIWNDLRLLLPQVRGTVLDVGCGAQPYRALFQDDVIYTGLDTSEARQHFGYDVPDTVYFSGSTWPVATAAADAILYTETLEHVLDTRAFLDEAYRVLRPGGHLFLTIPFAARWHFIPHDYWRFTPSGLEHVLREAGFTVVSVYARGNEWTVASYKVMSLVLSLLFGHPGNAPRLWGNRLVGLLLSPLLPLAAVCGSVSLDLAEGGDDCLGYTVVAERPGE